MKGRGAGHRPTSDESSSGRGRTVRRSDRVRSRLDDLVARRHCGRTKSRRWPRSARWRRSAAIAGRRSGRPSGPAVRPGRCSSRAMTECPADAGRPGPCPRPAQARLPPMSLLERVQRRLRRDGPDDWSASDGARRARRWRRAACSAPSICCADAPAGASAWPAR